MYNLIIFLPLIGAVLSWILGNRFSSIPTYIVSISCLFLSMIISWIAFYDIAILKNDFEGASLPWINSGEFRALWEFNFDTLSFLNTSDDLRYENKGNTQRCNIFNKKSPYTI